MPKNGSLSTSQETGRRPTDVLAEDHRGIRVLLDCLDRILLKAQCCGNLDLTGAQDVLSALETFVEGAHHTKEERILFPLIEERGISRRFSRSALLREDHDSGHLDLRAMKIALAAAGRGYAPAVAVFEENSRHYVDALREHIEKEDRVLFPLSEAALRDQDRQALLEAFARIDFEERGGSADLARAAEAFAVRFGVRSVSDRVGPANLTRPRARMPASLP